MLLPACGGKWAFGDNQKVDGRPAAQPCYARLTLPQASHTAARAEGMVNKASGPYPYAAL